MKKSNFYPVKYVIKEMKSKDLKNEINGYIVTKAYVIGDLLRYENGKSLKLYEIVYPFSQTETNIVPIFNSNNICTNSQLTQYVFNNKQSCKKMVDKLNSRILAKKVVKSTPGTAQDVIKAFKQNLRRMQSSSDEKLNQIFSEENENTNL